MLAATATEWLLAEIARRDRAALIATTRRRHPDRCYADIAEAVDRTLDASRS